MSRISPLFKPAEFLDTTQAATLGVATEGAIFLLLLVPLLRPLGVLVGVGLHATLGFAGFQQFAIMFPMLLLFLRSVPHPAAPVARLGARLPAGLQIDAIQGDFVEIVGSSSPAWPVGARMPRLAMRKALRNARMKGTTPRSLTDQGTSVTQMACAHHSPASPGASPPSLPMTPARPSASSRRVSGLSGGLPLLACASDAADYSRRRTSN